MKKLLPVWIGLVFFNFSCKTVPPKNHPETSNSDWSELFRSDLSNAIKPDGVWSFENGILTATEDQNIWTKTNYSNYILDLEFKTAPGTNSGVIVHCSNIEDWIPNSVEIQIADDYAEQWSNAPESWQCGAFFGHKPAEERMVKAAGEWNRYTITCKGNMIWVLLNGKEVNQMDMSLWDSAEVNPDGSEIPDWLNIPLAELPPRGKIGLQGKHAGAPIYFRNINIKEI